MAPVMPRKTRASRHLGEARQNLSHGSVLGILFALRGGDAAWGVNAAIRNALWMRAKRTLAPCTNQNRPTAAEEFIQRRRSGP
jgi:hypothetical protein